MANAGEVTLPVVPDASRFGRSLARDIDRDLSRNESRLSRSFGGLATIARTAMLAAGAAAGAALVVGINESINLESANDLLAAQLRLTETESERIGSVAGELYAGAYGESMEQVNTAIRAVVGQMGDLGDVTDDELSNAGARALDLARILETDVTRVTQVAGQAVRQGLAVDIEEAFDLIAAASAETVPGLQDDLLDAVDEYGQFFTSLGIDGPEAFGLLAAASEDGQYGIDKTGDAIKEFTIRATDMSTATQDAYESIGLNAGEMAEAVLAGGDTAADAFDSIVQGLLDIEDPVERANASIALFGTPLEDLSTSEIPDFLASLIDTENGLGDVAGAAAGMGDTLNDNLGTRLEQLKRGALQRLTDFLEGRLLPAFDAVSGFVGDHIAPLVERAADGFGRLAEKVALVSAFVADDLAPIVGSLRDHFTEVDGQLGSLGDQFGWLTETVGQLVSDGFQGLLNWWDTNGEDIVDLVSGAIDAISNIITGFVEAIGELWDRFGDDIITVMEGAWDIISGVVQTVTGVITGVIQTFIGVFTGDWDDMRDGLLRIWDSLWAGVGSILSGAASLVEGLIGGLISTTQGYWDGFTEQMSARWGGMWDSVVAAVTGIWDRLFVVPFTGLRDSVMGLWHSLTGEGGTLGTIRTAWDNMWSAVAGIVSNAWTTYIAQPFQTLRTNVSDAWALLVGAGDKPGLIRAAWDLMWNTVNGAIGGFTATLSASVGGIVDTLGRVWNGIKAAFAEPINWVIRNAINPFLSRARSVASALGFSIGIGDLPEIATYHDGGIAGDPASRMTSGPLRHNELLAKLERGEEVVPESDPRHRNNLAGREPRDDLADAIGGPFDTIRNLAGDAIAAARDLIANTVRPAIRAAMETLNNVGGGIPGQMAAGVGRRIGTGVLGWLTGADNAAKEREDELGGTLGSGSVGSTWQALWAYFRRTGVPGVKTSDQRYGTGSSYHNRGRAIDVSIGGHGNRGYGSAGLRRIFEAFLPIGRNLKELILAGAPFNIKNGNRVGGYAWGRPGSAGNHWNHVHVAAEDGAVFTGRYDGMMSIGETARSRPEIVTPERLMADTFRTELAAFNAHVRTDELLEELIRTVAASGGDLYLDGSVISTRVQGDLAARRRRALVKGMTG